MFQNRYGEYDAELVRIAKFHAKGLVGNYGYTPGDADDLLQTLILAGVIALARFDESQAKRSTYLYAILRDKVADLARHAERQKRDRRKESFSLDAEWPGDESGETVWADLIGADSTVTEEGCSRRDRADLHGLRIDLEEALAKLPSNLRKLCRLHSVLGSEDARRAAGMAYSTHHRAIKRIRAHFERRGFFPNKNGRDHGTASDHSEGNL